MTTTTTKVKQQQTKYGQPEYKKARSYHALQWLYWPQYSLPLETCIAFLSYTK